MKIQRSAQKGNLHPGDHREFPCGSRWVLASLLAVLSSGFLSAAELSWLQLPLVLPTDTASLASSGGVLPAADGVVAAFGDQTQCRAGNDAGVKGLITMTDAGLNGAFLALWWDESGALTATVRTADSLPVESFTLRDGKQTELILVRRGGTIYSYAVASGVADPLIAMDFASGSSIVAGSLVDKDSNGQTPAMSPVVTAPTLTGDVLLNQPAPKLEGDWISEDDPNSLAHSHLLNRGDDADEFAIVRIENLLPGTHELWIRYVATQSRTEQVAVTVEGFGDPVLLVVNQRISGGLWLPLGRFEAGSVTSATIRLAPGSPGSGSLSLDAVHEVWSFWADENKDQLPDAVEGANPRNPLVKDGASALKGADLSGEDNFSTSEPPSLTAADKLAVSDGSKVVIFVHPSLGDDSYDGRSGKPQLGAWFSTRKGPKKTIEAALKCATRSIKEIELHLDGSLEPPPTGFQDLGDFGITLIVGDKGASLESKRLSSSPPISPPPLLPPPAPPRVLGKH